MKGSRGTFYTKLLGMFIATVLRAIYCYTGRLRDSAGGVVVTKGEVAAARSSWRDSLYFLSSSPSSLLLTLDPGWPSAGGPITKASLGSQTDLIVKVVWVGEPD